MLVLLPDRFHVPLCNMHSQTIMHQFSMIHGIWTMIAGRSANTESLLCPARDNVDRCALPLGSSLKDSVRRLKFCFSFCCTGDQVTLCHMASNVVPVRDRQHRLRLHCDITCACPRCIVEENLPSSVHTKIQVIHAKLGPEIMTSGLAQFSR